MLVTSQILQRGLENLNEGKALFPVFRHLAPNGDLDVLENASYGCAFTTRSVFDAVDGVPAFNSWGGEDNLFHGAFNAHVGIIREPVSPLTHL